MKMMCFVPFCFVPSCTDIGKQKNRKTKNKPHTQLQSKSFKIIQIYINSRLLEKPVGFIFCFCYFFLKIENYICVNLLPATLHLNVSCQCTLVYSFHVISNFVLKRYLFHTPLINVDLLYLYRYCCCTRPR